MSDYRTLRQEERKAAMYHLALCVLAVMDDDVIDLLNMGPAIKSGINSIRAGEDDYAGCAAAFFAFNISNYDLTEQDRLVVSQSLAVGAGAVANRRVATKNMFDAEDVLTNRNIIENIMLWVSEAPAPAILTGDAVFEQGKELLTYMEQYNMHVKDQSRTWTKGGTNEDETAVSESSILDLIPFVGKQ